MGRFYEDFLNILLDALTVFPNKSILLNIENIIIKKRMGETKMEKKKNQKQRKKGFCLILALCMMMCSLVIPSPVKAQVVKGNVDSVDQVQNLKAGICSLNGINMRWEKVEGASGYEVWRCLARNGKWWKVKDIAPNNQAFLNRGLKSGKEYFYKVRAFKRTSSGKKYGKFSSILRANTKLSKSFKVRVNALSGLHIRKYAGTDYSVLATAPFRTKLTVLCLAQDKKGAKWYRVSVKIKKKKYTGYVHSKYVR